MPYPATHLFFSSLIAKALNVVDLPSFYLGSIAPDSVIFRPSWTNRDKYTTHLCTGDHDYADVSNTDEWLQNALSMWETWRHDPAPCFFLGWICHVMLDLQHTDEYVLPCKRDCASVMKDGRFRGDMVLLDRVLCFSFVADEILPVLRRCDVTSNGYPPYSIEQLGAIRQNVCDKQYADIHHMPEGSFAYIHQEEYIDFIHRTASAALRNLC